MADNYVMGAGRLYFAPEDPVTGLALDERYLGDTPGFEVQIESTTVPKFSSDGPTEELVDQANTRTVRNSQIQVENIDDDNLGLFFQADQSTVTGAGGAVTDEAINGVKQDRYYQLGQSNANPTGERDVSAVTVTDDSGSPVTFTVTDDYTVDAALGRIYIVPGGAITDGTNLRVDYTQASTARSRLASNDNGPVRGALRFIADNTRGTNRDLYAPRAQLTPNGPLPFKSRDTWQQLQLATAFLKKDPLEQVYIDGRAA